MVGDNSSLNKIDSIDTETVDMSAMQGDNEMEVKLNLPSGISTQNGEKTVKVQFKVKKEENATKNLTCNVQSKNLNDTFIVDSQNLTTNVTLTGIQSALDKITEKNINVVLDLSKVKEEGTFEYTPQAALVNADGVTVSNVGKVSVAIKKKS